MTKQTAVIIGGGPAGLTAAYELVQRSDIIPVVYEMSDHLGGLAKTLNHKGNRIDIGGHRFFSKSDRVMEWWTHILPLEDEASPDQGRADKVMLVRQRRSRILFHRRFFDYPLTLSLTTLRKLGVSRVFRIMLSYLRAQLIPLREEENLEQFFINRFGRELYETFFKDYSEKVWGIPCSEIKAEWGAQRIKGLSVSRVLLHAAKSLVRKGKSIEQKDIETSLIDQFLYPKYGPGQLWEEVGRIVSEAGGEVHRRHRVIGLTLEGNRVLSVEVENTCNGERFSRKADYFFSSMAVQDLIRASGDSVPPEVRDVSEGLCYRDFITVGVLLKRLREGGTYRENLGQMRDNWIYVQEGDVRVARIQVFNNWSPYMVKDPATVWLGLEYCCNEGDQLWNLSDDALSSLAIKELEEISFIDRNDVLDSIAIRTEKAYPAYTGRYEQFSAIRSFTDAIENLFLVGRNGMHRYNNQDHSMLTAIEAVDAILRNDTSKTRIWEVNTEATYHEKRSG